MCAVREIREAIAARGGGPAAAHFMDRAVEVVLFVQLPPQKQQQQRQGRGCSGDYSQHGLTGARKSGRPSCLREGASEAAV